MHLFTANRLGRLSLPNRVAMASGAELATPDPTKFYSPGPGGYVDYPAL